MKKITIIALIIFMVISCSCKKSDYQKLKAGDTSLYYSSVEGENLASIDLNKYTMRNVCPIGDLVHKEDVKEEKEISVIAAGINMARASYIGSSNTINEAMMSTAQGTEIDNYIFSDDRKKMEIAYFSGTNIVAEIYCIDDGGLENKVSKEVSEEEVILMAEELLGELLPNNYKKYYQRISVNDVDYLNCWAVLYERNITEEITVGERIGIYINYDGTLKFYKAGNFMFYDNEILEKIDPNELTEISKQFKNEILADNAYEDVGNPSLAMTGDGEMYLKYECKYSDVSMLFFYKELKLE